MTLTASHIVKDSSPRARAHKIKFVHRGFEASAPGPEEADIAGEGPQRTERQAQKERMAHAASVTPSRYKSAVPRTVICNAGSRAIAEQPLNG